MRKTQTLFTMALLVLLGSMGAAQAQDFAEVNYSYATTQPSRPDGWRKRDVRQHLAHFFHRAAGAVRRSDSHA